MPPPAHYRVTESSLDLALRYRTVIDLLAPRWRDDLEILEVGAGSAGVTEFLDHPVTGVDTAFERTADRRTEWLTQVRGSADALPFPDGSFDVVLTLEMLEHIAPHRREPALHEMFRVLREGGRMVATFPADETAERLDRWLNDSYRRKAGRDHPWSIEHIRMGVPRTEEMVEAARRVVGEAGTIRVHRHMWGPSFRLVHGLYTARRLSKLTRPLGLHTRVAARGLFALCSRLHREPAYRTVLVIDKA